MSVARTAGAFSAAAVTLAGGLVLLAPASVQAATCHVNLREGVDSVRVHANPDTSSTTFGVLYPGQSLPSACFDGSGGMYTDCGGTSNNHYWVTVYWGRNRTPAAVASKCVWINVD